MPLYDTKTYRADVGGHEVNFEFDRTGVVVNRGRLIIDEREVDSRALFWGKSNVRGELRDGRAFTVEFESGAVGQLKNVVLVLDGERIDLKDTADGPPAKAG
jgi:hypothetical protein